VHVDITLETDQRSDEQLAADAAREGSDGPAFQALCARYQERVWRTCCRLVGNAEDASDAAQEVLVKMFMQRAQFKRESQYSTWVHGIAIRTCLMLRRGSGRRRQRETKAFEERQRRESIGDLSPQDASLDLAQILETLDEEERAMLIMKYAEGHSYSDLAAMFGKTASACKMRISRARQQLKERFPDQHFGGDDG
jgi:RNA polymerase sigma-70 factor (ECF subfamily)